MILQGITAVLYAVVALPGGQGKDCLPYTVTATNCVLRRFGKLHRKLTGRKVHLVFYVRKPIDVGAIYLALCFTTTIV